MTNTTKAQPLFPNERAFQDNVIKAAEQFGWLVYHTHDSRRSQPGFPDLVLVRGSMLLFAELKTDKGIVSEAQKRWLDALRASHTRWNVFVWRCRDWKTIIHILANREGRHE